MIKNSQGGNDVTTFDFISLLLYVFNDLNRLSR